MMFLSVLLKAYAVLLWSQHPAIAAVCWMGGLGADFAWARRVRDILLVQVASLLAAAAACAIHLEATVRWKDGCPLAAQVLSLGMRAVGVPLFANNGVLHTSTMAGILEFPADLDSLGILPPLLFALLAMVCVLVTAPDWGCVGRAVAWLAAALLGAMILRWMFTVLCFLFLTDFVGYETEELPMLPFFKPGLIAALYLPFLIAVAGLLHRQLAPVLVPADDVPFSPLPGRPLLTPVLFALLLIVLWEPGGTPKTGEVLINTFHTQWSRTDRPYDREWYGSGSGYNYACMKDWFQRFYPTRELTTRISAQALANASVLVLYDPDRAFTENEIRAIHTFVERGGGLFLIGDHTNVFGGTSHLNTVCRPFGFIFRDDVLFDLDEDFFQLYDVPRGHSPLLQGIDFFKFRGPASIQPTSWFTRTVFRVDHAKSLRAIYSVNNFYPPPHDHPKMRTGSFASAVSSRYGRGRVHAFADSTIFSNFEIFYPGKYEYLLNVANWLDHADSPMTRPLQRLGCVAALVVLALQLWGSRRPRGLLGTLLGAGCAGAAAWWVCILAAQARTEFPPPVEPLDALFFAAAPDDDPYTLRRFVTQAPYEQKYDVFIQWVLRTGRFSGFYLVGPEHQNHLYHHLADADPTRTGMALIVREPNHLDLLREVGALADANPLLLLISTAESLTREAVLEALDSSGVLGDSGGLAEIETAWPSGELRLQDGKRRIAVVLPAETYSDREMGFTEKVTPSPENLALYQQQFTLLDWLFARDGSSITEGDAP